MIHGERGRQRERRGEGEGEKERGGVGWGKENGYVTALVAA